MVHPSLLRGNYPTRVSFSLSSSRFNAGRLFEARAKGDEREREREKGRHPSSLRRGPSHPAARFARINTRHPNRSPSHPLFACAACLPACQNLPTSSKSLRRIPNPSASRDAFQIVLPSPRGDYAAIVPRVTLPKSIRSIISRPTSKIGRRFRRARRKEFFRDDGRAWDAVEHNVLRRVEVFSLEFSREKN